LIPVATVEASVDIDEEYGFLLNDFKIEYIEERIKEIVQMPSYYLKRKAIRAVEYSHENYNAESYKTDVLNALKSLGV
jgi:hypothetical protein